MHPPCIAHCPVLLPHQPCGSVNALPVYADLIMARVNTTACIVYMDGAEFDGIFIVDGLGIMWDGVYNSEIIRVVQESLRAGKKVAAVGHGVAALCNVTDDRGNFIVAGKQVPSPLGVLSAALTSALALPVVDHTACAIESHSCSCSQLAVASAWM